VRFCSASKERFIPRLRFQRAGTLAMRGGMAPTTVIRIEKTGQFIQGLLIDPALELDHRVK
jgi:hypothetical protein